MATRQIWTWSHLVVFYLRVINCMNDMREVLKSQSAEEILSSYSYYVFSETLHYITLLI